MTTYTECTKKAFWPTYSLARVTHLVPCDGAVYRVCVLKAVCFFHLVDFVYHSKPLPYEGFVRNHHLQILHHLTGCIYVHILIVISANKQNSSC